MIEEGEETMEEKKEERVEYWREEGRQRKRIFYALTHFLNNHNGKGWARNLHV